jgi:hypothetical protein
MDDAAGSNDARRTSIDLSFIVHHSLFAGRVIEWLVSLDRSAGFAAETV